MRVFVQISENGRKVPMLKHVSGRAATGGLARGRVTTSGCNPFCRATTITEERLTGRVAILRGRQVMRYAERASSGLAVRRVPEKVRRRGRGVPVISAPVVQGSAIR